MNYRQRESQYRQAPHVHRVGHVDGPAMVSNGLLLSASICACMTPYRGDG